MINASMYKSILASHGKNLAQVKRNQSDLIMNTTFTGDPTYKRVYILTQDGWRFEDAKYQFHTAKSILRDDVDYYLQFRPKTHYPIGTYVIVPDDTDDKINLTESELTNPFLQNVKDRTQWWVIVGRDNANAFVRYNILKCNWDFKWVVDGKIQHCFGIIRNANSYTSGVWRDEYSSSLDNLTGMWLPDLHYVYGDNLHNLGMDDNRTIMHEQRFMITNNALDPRVYQVTKIVDTSPQGIIKISIKQDEYNEYRDNIDERVCDYYDFGGESKLTDLTEENLSTPSQIYWMQINNDGELEYLLDKRYKKLSIGEYSYFKVEFPENDIVPEWHIKLFNDDNRYTEDEELYYDRLIKFEIFDDNILAVKPSKAGSLSGKAFILSVGDSKGNYPASMLLEVE